MFLRRDYCPGPTSSLSSEFDGSFVSGQRDLRRQSHACEEVWTLSEMACKKGTMSMLIPRPLVQRICIWFCVMDGLKQRPTYRKLKTIFRRGCYCERSVYRWFHAFKSGCTKLGDMLHPGTPKRSRTAAKVDQCRQLVAADRRIGIHKISSTLSISYGSAFTLLHKDLELSKKAAKLISHQLTQYDIQRRLDFCTEFVSIYGARPEGLNWIVTTDESWFHLLDPRSKFENMQWLSKEDQRPQVVRHQRSVHKVMVVPFFDSRGLVHCEFFQNVTIKGSLFLQILLRARDSIRARRGSRVWLRRREYRLHMDNAPAHREDTVLRTLDFMEWPLLKHPPYSPDLSPCDFFLFPLLKRRLRGRQFTDIPALKVAILAEIGNIPSAQWKRCFSQWIERCRKCLAFRGRYFEGMK